MVYKDLGDPIWNKQRTRFSSTDATVLWPIDMKVFHQYRDGCLTVITSNSMHWYQLAGCQFPQHNPSTLYSPLMFLSRTQKWDSDIFVHERERPCFLQLRKFSFWKKKLSRGPFIQPRLSELKGCLGIKKDLKINSSFISPRIPHNIATYCANKFLNCKLRCAFFSLALLIRRFQSQLTHRI